MQPRGTTPFGVLECFVPCFLQAQQPPWPPQERKDILWGNTKRRMGGIRSRARARFIASYSAVYQCSILPCLPSLQLNPQPEPCQKPNPSSVPVPEAAAAIHTEPRECHYAPWQLQCLSPFRASLPRAVSVGADHDHSTFFLAYSSAEIFLIFQSRALFFSFIFTSIPTHHQGQ